MIATAPQTSNFKIYKQTLPVIEGWAVGKDVVGETLGTTVGAVVTKDVSIHTS